MKFVPWQVVLTCGFILLAVKLLIDLLVPIGLVLVVISIVLYFQQQNDKPKVIKK